MIEMGVDMGPMMEATGVVDGVAGAVESDVYVNYIVDHAAAVLRDKFNTDFLAVAMSNPRNYHHVFEWGSLGYHGALQDSGVDVPMPLFRLTTEGRGKNKTVGFSFRQSRISTPFPDAGATGIPEENIARLKRRHVFRFKAYVMESGMRVHIARKEAKMLFVPTPGAENNFLFKHSYSTVPGSGVAGNFTAFWAAWWATSAPTHMEERVIPEVEKRMALVANKQLSTIRRGSRIKAKAFKIQPASELRAMAENKARMTTNQIMRDSKAWLNEDEDWEDE